MSRTVYYSTSGNEIEAEDYANDEPTYAQEQFADIERRKTVKDVSSNENVGELKKKVLELCDVIDKQNDYIKKYQMALEMASVDIVKAIDECVDECNACPKQSYCESHRHDAIRLDCDDVFLESWKKKAGLF